MTVSRSVFALSLLSCAACSGGSSSPSPPAPVASPNPTTTSTPKPASSPTPVQTATATPSPTVTVPSPEASEYALVASDVAGYTAAVDAQCPQNPAASTRVDVELLDANANYLVSVLPGKSVAQAQQMAANAVGFAVAVHKALPGVGFMINPLYPVLVRNQTNAPAWWNASANYPIFSAYYRTLAQGLAQNGIPYDAEANLVFPSYNGGQNYSDVTLNELEAGIAEDASNLLVAMSPQYLNIASEPLTLSENTGQSTLDTVSGFASFANDVRSSMSVPPSASTLIGAGSADWSQPAFLSAIEAVPNLAYDDEHLYPPDVLTTAGGGIAQVDAIAPAVTGKPGLITENWDEKDAGDAANYGAANAPELEQQDTYAFWSPIDAQYVTTTVKLARCENLSVVAFWYVNELFAYLDYGSASTMSPSKAQAAEASAAAQALSAGTLSPSGAALYGSLTNAPAATMSTRRR